MGLDAIELLMDVEESFGIEIPDSAAQNILTVGELHDFIISKTDLASNDTCLSAATFYDVKRALRSHGISARFRPSTNLADVIPHSDRRDFWSDLSASAELRLPRLERSSTVSFLNTFLTLTSSFIIAGLIHRKTGSIEISFISLLFFGIVFAVLTTSATVKLATHFGTNVKTFRGLSERVLSLNAAKQNSKHGPMGPNDIWVILRDLIADQLGVDNEKITPNARFVEDLGLE